MHVLDLIFFLKCGYFHFHLRHSQNIFFKIEAAYTHCQASKKCPYIDFKQSDYLFTFCDSVEDWRV